jgi:S-adenosylmethionine:tRNA ribosyltransferase-isomerase
MKRQDFFYDLPSHLIAHYPKQPRHSARLLAYDRQTNQLQHHSQVLDLVDYLTEDDLLVFNNTKVLPARLFGEKTTGGKVEILFERLLSQERMLCHLRASKAPKLGSKIHLGQDWILTVEGRQDALFDISVNGPVFDLLYAHGHVPLPPYIDRPDEASDHENYQTIFAKHEGSVAAPTASLHFDDFFLEKIREKGISMGFVTLHVGAGTFQPVRADNIHDHVMHEEWYEISSELIKLIEATRAKGGRVIAVGTTSLRAMESAAQEGLSAKSGLTRLFITPGYQFQIIDGLMTNFHLPESSLMMLVSALIGQEKLMEIYQEAVAQEYRFFSYGDACLFL